MPQPLSPQLRALQEEVEAHARSYGLDFFETIYEVLDWEEINEVAAYGGYPARYPHWRFGMEYVELSRSYSYGLSRIYEMVINNDPTYAYLLAANHYVDQKLVMAHVCGHGDFFKHNFMFSGTNRKMLDEMANHASRVRRYMERHGVDEVEGLLDRCLSLDNLIDYSALHSLRVPTAAPAAAEEDGHAREPRKMRAKGYMDSFINPPAAMRAERERLDRERRDEERFPARPERDVMLFLQEHAPLRNWERDVLGMLREEAYYFAPQGRTKIANEGWACVGAGTLVFTEVGLIPMADVVVGIADVVYDGERRRRIYDQNIIRDQETLRIRTRRGLELVGSRNHRVLLADGQSWKRLDELQPKDRLAISGGGGVWPDDLVDLQWRPRVRATLEAVAASAGVSLSTLIRYRAGRAVTATHASSLSIALDAYEEQGESSQRIMPNRRATVRIPMQLDESLAAFLGYLVGDGHISRVKHEFGLTTGDEEQAERYAGLVDELFGLKVHVRLDGGRLRVLACSETVSDFLVDVLGLTEGPSARRKRIPDAVLRSPEPVVRAFLRAYFDCDGYGGRQGVILSTSSGTLAEQVQLLLLNYEILSRKRKQKDDCWHVHVFGISARRFAELIGFGLERKQRALLDYVAAHRRYKVERWEDEVAEITHGRADVYDISVRETNRYAAAGFINHNSFWHSKMMTEKLLDPSELIDYADHHSGTMATSPGRLNPYKVGIELWRDIEERWDRGRHGPDWEACDDYAVKRSWDTGAMQGREKIFEVRRHYNDVTFIDEFLTPDFVRRHGLFTYEYDRRTNQYVIADRDFRAVKEKLLFMLTNFGQPTIEVADANFLNRGELLLVHRYEGVPLKIDQALETLEHVQSLWKRPVNLETFVDDEAVVLSYDGVEHRTETALVDRS